MTKDRWVYRVINPSTAKTDEYTDETEALRRAKIRASRERGEVAVEKALLTAGDILNYNKPGAGIVWRSDWRSAPLRRARRR